MRPDAVDYLRHAEELAHFAQSIKFGIDSIGCEVVAAHVETKRQDTRMHRTRHVVFDCKARVVFDDETSNKINDMVLTLTEKSSVARKKGAKTRRRICKKKRIVRTTHATKRKFRPTRAVFC